MSMYSNEEAEIIRKDARLAYEKKRRSNPFSMAEPAAIWADEYNRLKQEAAAKKPAERKAQKTGRR